MGDHQVMEPRVTLIFVSPRRAGRRQPLVQLFIEDTNAKRLNRVPIGANVDDGQWRDRPSMEAGKHEASGRQRREHTPRTGSSPSRNGLYAATFSHATICRPQTAASY